MPSIACSALSKRSQPQCAKRDAPMMFANKNAVKVCAGRIALGEEQLHGIAAAAVW